MTPIIKAKLAAILAISALTTGASHAMEIYNCTNASLPVTVTHGQTGQNYGSASVAPGQGMAWNTGRGNGFRVNIKMAGPDKRFSNRNGGEVISIANIAGSTELVNGRKCRPSAQKTAQSAAKSQAGDQIKGALGSALMGILSEKITN